MFMQKENEFGFNFLFILKVLFLLILITGHNNMGYIWVTSHFINENWNLEKKLVSFRELDYPHTRA